MTEEVETSPKEDRQERRRRSLSAARLASVQALYQMELTGQNWKDISGEFEAHRFGEIVDGEELQDADQSLFRRTLEGAVTHQKPIDKAVNATLKASWPLRRIDPTLRALFRAAGSEFLSSPDTPRKVVINEYVEVAKAFFDGEEPRFANAVIDALGRALRPEPKPEA